MLIIQINAGGMIKKQQNHKQKIWNSNGLILFILFV